MRYDVLLYLTNARKRLRLEKYTNNIKR